jgi:ssDNA-binding replication factor A large subunit
MRSRRLLVTLLAAPLAAAAWAGERKVQLQELPPAVQAAVQVQTRDLAHYRISEEQEDGKTVYEVETTVNGLSRDLLIDTSGLVVEVEEEIDPARLPEAARKSVASVSGGGIIRKVEAVTRDGVTEYEVAIKGGNGRSRVFVTGDGTIRKE